MAVIQKAPLAAGTKNAAAPPAITLTGWRIAKAIGFRDDFTTSSSLSKGSAILTSYQ